MITAQENADSAWRGYAAFGTAEIEAPAEFVSEKGTLRILRQSHSRALQTGLELLRQRPLVLLGMSPGNAFFTRKRIDIAVRGMAHLFGEVVLVVPDTIAIHTYRALGYDERQSRAKAKKTGRA